MGVTPSARRPSAKRSSFSEDKPPPVKASLPKDKMVEGRVKQDMVSTAAQRFYKLRAVKGSDKEEREQEKAILAADTDGDGVISEQELRAFKAKQKHSSSTEVHGKEETGELAEDASR